MSQISNALSGEQIYAKDRKRSVGLGIIALIIASGLAWAVYSIISAYQYEASVRTASVQGVAALVAVSDLEPGTLLAEEHLEMRAVPEGIPTEELFSELDLLVGQTLSERVLSGEPLRPLRLVVPGVSTMRVDEVLDPNSRALSLRLDAEASLGGLLRPGHFVDVMLTIPMTTKAGTAEWVTEVVLQGVRVVAVDEQVAPGPAGIAFSLVQTDSLSTRLVTVEVDPMEAKRLVHANERGEVHLVLRGANNYEFTDYGAPLVTSALVGLPEDDQSDRMERKKSIGDRASQGQRTRQVIEILRGTQRSTVER